MIKIIDNIFLSNLIITNICGSMRITSVPDIITHRRFRECWCIAIKTSGSTEYICGGKSIISDKNHIVLLPKGCSYSWQTTGGECLLIDFEADLSYDEIISFKIKDNSYIISLFVKIERERVSATPFFSLNSLRYTYDILSELIFTQQNKYIPSQKHQIIQPVINYILNNYTNPHINGEVLGEMSGVSNIYFRKLFTEIFGCPPIKYIHRLRMKKAAEMLKSDFNSVSTIAEAVGYNSVYNFSKMFKKYYGVAPSKISVLNNVMHDNN